MDLTQLTDVMCMPRGGGLLPIYKVLRVCQHLGYTQNKRRVVVALLSPISAGQ